MYDRKEYKLTLFDDILHTDCPEMEQKKVLSTGTLP